MVWLSGLLPYEQATRVFERIGHRTLPRATLCRRTAEHGERLRTYWEGQQAQVSPERVVLHPVDHHQPKGVSMDGWMVHIRGEGWKECKIGAVYDVVLEERPDPQTGDKVERARASRIGYTAVLGEVTRFAPALWALAVERRVPEASHSSVTADGAEWIWNLAADLFPDSIQIVDWYHADQHLAQAAQALFPDHPDQAARWRKSMQQPLFAGQVWTIIQALHRAGLPDHAHYFEQHQRRMQYLEFQEDGHPIGSGSVESACKQFQARLKGPGMRWSRPGAERMLVIRAAVLSDSFEHLWRAA
jgi:hypothetical protein